MWDYNIGLVRITPFFKCLKYSKVRMSRDLQGGIVDNSSDNSGKDAQLERRFKGNYPQHHWWGIGCSRYAVLFIDFCPQTNV